MAYFPNGTAGEVFDNQCSKCKYGEMACPIAGVQLLYNYAAVNNDVATKILNDLVSDEGICFMFNEFKEDLTLPVK